MSPKYLKTLKIINGEKEQEMVKTQSMQTVKK